MRRVAVVLGVLLLPLGFASSAWASGNSGAASHGKKADTNVEKSDSTPPANGRTPKKARRSGPPPQCTGRRYGDVSPRPIGGGSGDVHYEPADAHTQEFENSLSPHPPGTGAWYYKYCGPGDNYFAGVVWLPNGSGGAGQAQVSPLALAEQAAASVEAPTPKIGMNPATEQLVGMMTWLWIDTAGGAWQPASATASTTDGSVSSTVTISPYAVVWDMGDGHSFTCNGPGTPYGPGAAPDPCSHYTYRQSSAGAPGNAFQVTATTKWHVTWTTNVAGGGGSLPDLTSDPASVDVRVAESQAINNG